MIFQVVSKIRGWKESWDAVRAPKQDNNLYYGLYYRCQIINTIVKKNYLKFLWIILFRSDSTRIDESTVEFKDANDYYEASSSQ